MNLAIKRLFRGLFIAWLTGLVGPISAYCSEYNEVFAASSTAANVTPVPEPSTLALFAGGLAALIFIQRLRKDV